MAELERLREKAAGGLQAELGACRRRLEREKKLRLRAQARAAQWRRRAEELNKEIEDMKGREKATSSIEVQTEESSVWSYADYRFYHNYYSNSDPDNLPSLPIQTDNEISKSTCTEELQLSDHPNGNDVKDDEQGEHNNVIHTVQKSEDNLLTESSLVESLRAAAEAAVSQTGFVYDENTGLYYDHNTGFYYDSENQLYYDPATGIYYYCDIESGRYHFHSRVDLQSYGSANTQNSKDKKGKKKRKDAEWSTANEHKEDDQKSPNSLNCFSAINELNHPEEESASTKRMKVDTDRKNSLLSKEPNTLNDTSLHLRNTPCTAAVTDDSKSESESEPEEGEITNSEEEESTSDEEVRSEGTVNSEDTDSEDGDKIWPPCIRVIVIRSPVLQMGSLYIITAVKPATIGREKAMEHTLHIPELGVSKFHAEVYFDHELQSYVLVDQGSQNGTVVNGNQILQPKTKSEPHILEHGDEVKIGETVLSFHIHPGSETCDGCEPGQVRAHLRLDKKNKCSVGPVLTKEEKELIRRKAMKQIRVKYGLQNTEYENEKILKNPNYKDRAEKRRETVGSEGSFHRDDAPASVDVEITHRNRGHKLLEKMGWKKGEGLGKCGAGRKDPIKLQMHRKHAGLGSGTPVSIEDIQIINTNKRNWEKARERFAENFQDSKSQKNIPKDPTWIRETAE